MTIDLDDITAILPHLRRPMLDAAGDLDRKLNPPGGIERTGFIILAFPFGDKAGRCNLLTNVERDDIEPILRAQLEQWANDGNA